MEPDFDKLASNKIRQAELKVTPWNKESVWQNVISETTRSARNNSLRYSHAAAVLLLLLLGIHPIHDNKIQYAEVNRNPHEQIAEPQKEFQLDTSGNNIINNIAQPAKKNDVIPMPEIPQPTSHNTLSVNYEKEVVEPTIEPIVAHLEFKVEEFLLPETDTIGEQKIRPIVGVITESYSEEVAKVKRKKSLHKLESLEPVPWENVPHALVFARKK